ncbi:hypothetical protein AB1Y20_022975 [Prymnesium parvum]|uniref:Hexosyltransferase n=1 Tax=Prymnesium parvum TaxID=97485 RepID=A0AB34JDM8_PRYPA
MRRCHPSDWGCRCASRGECPPPPLLDRLLPPLVEWTPADVAAFLLSLGPAGARQTCPHACALPPLFSAPLAAAFEAHRLNGSALLALASSPPPHALPPLSHLPPATQRLLSRRLLAAIRHTPLGQPHALWLAAAPPPPHGRRRRGAAVLSALLRRGWRARLSLPPHQAADGADPLLALARRSPHAVSLDGWPPCAPSAREVAVYTRGGVACGGASASLSVEAVLRGGSCRAHAACAACAALAARGGAVGAVVVDGDGEEQALLVHRVLSDGRLRRPFPPRLLLPEGNGTDGVARELLEAWAYSPLPAGGGGWTQWVPYEAGAPMPDTGLRAAAVAPLLWRFVIGQLRACPPRVRRELGCAAADGAAACARLAAEQAAFADLELLVHAADCEGKNSVAPKTLEWYVRAVAQFPHAAWIGKIDDDSALNFARVAHDLVDMEAVGVRCGGAALHAYYGALRWRLWSLAWRSGCGGVFAANGVGRQAVRPFRWLRREREARCNRSTLPLGPLPYADGALHLFSRALAAAVFGGGGEARRTVDGFMREGGGGRGRSDGRPWTQEDVGIGFLVYAESIVRRLPTFYFALSTQHYKRIGGEIYRDMRRAEFIGAYKRAVVAHKIFDSTVYNYSVNAFAKFTTDIDRFYCQSCEAAWGWDTIDQLEASDLMRGTAAPQMGAMRGQLFGCCEKSALDRGMFTRVDNLSNADRCFRDWEAPVKGLVKYHRKMPSEVAE